MKDNYLCPHCKKTLNIEEDIILIGENNNKDKGIIFLHTELGNYSSKKTDNFSIKKGEIIKLYCPFCNKDLTFKEEKTYSYLLKVEKEECSSIIFSSKYGEKHTFKLKDKKIETYGEIAAKYTNPDWFL